MDAEQSERARSWDPRDWRDASRRPSRVGFTLAAAAVVALVAGLAVASETVHSGLQDPPIGPGCGSVLTPVEHAGTTCDEAMSSRVQGASLLLCLAIGLAVAAVATTARRRGRFVACALWPTTYLMTLTWAALVTLAYAGVRDSESISLEYFLMLVVTLPIGVVAGAFGGGEAQGIVLALYVGGLLQVGVAALVMRAVYGRPDRRENSSPAGGDAVVDAAPPT